MRISQMNVTRAGSGPGRRRPGPAILHSSLRSRALTRTVLRTHPRRGVSRDSGRLLRVLVDLHEAQVVLSDLLGGVLALDAAVEEALQGVPPDRATDGEADKALDRSGFAQPV